MKLNVPLSFQLSAYGLSASFSSPAALIALRTTALAGSSPAGRVCAIARHKITEEIVSKRMMELLESENRVENRSVGSAAVICNRKMGSIPEWIDHANADCFASVHWLKPALGRASKQELDQSTIPLLRLAFEPILTAIDPLYLELLPRFDAVSLPQLDGENDLSFGGNDSRRARKIGFVPNARQARDECRRWDLNPHSREGTGF